MTQALFLDQPALARTEATVVASAADGIVLDRTVFYARGGGQPGDIGVLRWPGGETAIADTVKGEGNAILHLPAAGAALSFRNRHAARQFLLQLHRCEHPPSRQRQLIAVMG